MDDKRSKLLKVTKKGEEQITECRLKIVKMAEMMTFDMPDDDKELCINLLKHTEIKFSNRWLSDKLKKFDEIYDELVAAKNP